MYLVFFYEFLSEYNYQKKNYSLAEKAVSTALKQLRPPDMLSEPLRYTLFGIDL
jgi:hypothetical protein